MTEAVMDASAVLADFWDEPGAEVVRAIPPGAVISAVNLAEVITKLIDRGLSGEQAQRAVNDMSYGIVEADEGRATLAGLLHEKTRRTGVSLGDRFCLALARETDAPAITSDRRWQDLDLGVEITLIR
jgi:PIN domain nuclease of toxin-antitoxin system